MKENSIEEDIKILEEFKTNGYNVLLMKYGDRIKTNFKLAKAIEHILSDYKRVLKENEKRMHDNITLKNFISALFNDSFEKDYISVQKIKDKIEKLNDESHAEELEDIMNRKNYTITELVQYVLQELLDNRK